MPSSDRRARHPQRTPETVPARPFQPWGLAATGLSWILLTVVAVAATMMRTGSAIAERSPVVRLIGDRIQPDSASIQAIVSSIYKQSPNPDDYEEIEPEHWRTIDFTINLPNGARCDFWLTRPLPWLEALGIKVGEFAELSMPEMGVMGPALVKSIKPCKPSNSEPNTPVPAGKKLRRVTGRFVTTNAELLDLFVQGLAEPIGATASHPFYSVDRGTWVAAGNLRPGERLRTESGLALFLRAERKPGTATVYNIEVHKSHNFYVSKANLLVHNECVPDLGRKLEYVFGNATGHAHNVERSTDLARQLNRIGIQGDASGRQLLTEHFTMTLNNPMNIVLEEGAKQTRESLLAGPGGFLKMRSVWQNNRLVTVFLFGGG